MKIEDIKFKKIGLFVENGTGSYTRPEDAKIKELIDIYLENGGFFVLIDKEDYKFIGYLDVADLDLIKGLVKDIATDGNKKIKELKGTKINFREETIEYDTPVIEVLSQLNKSNQIFFPIVKGEVLVGRISKKILIGKIEDLY